MIEFVPETGSTSADLAARITAGETASEGTWLVTDRQTAGRGRRGRTWLDQAGNFMGSTLVRCRAGDPAPETLALAAALAVHAAVDGFAPGRASLKWPNDILVGTAKLAGILLERVGDAVVIGIGVNLVAAPPLADRQAIALADFATPPSRDAFAQALDDAFAAELERWRSYGLEPIIRRWLAAAHLPGTQLSVDQPEGTIVGHFETLAQDGALLLRLPDGTLRAIRAGEVRLAATQPFADRQD